MFLCLLTFKHFCACLHCMCLLKRKNENLHKFKLPIKPAILPYLYLAMSPQAQDCHGSFFSQLNLSSFSNRHQLQMANSQCIFVCNSQFCHTLLSGLPTPCTQSYVLLFVFHLPSQLGKFAISFCIYASFYLPTSHSTIVLITSYDKTALKVMAANHTRMQDEQTVLLQSCWK